MSILLQMIGLVTAYLLASWLMTFLPGWVLMGALLAFYFCLPVRLAWGEYHAQR